MSTNFKTALATIQALQRILTGEISHVPVKSLPASRDEIKAIAAEMGLAIARNGRYGLNVYRPIIMKPLGGVE